MTFGGLEGSAVAGHNGGWGGRMPLYRPVPGVTPHGTEHSTWQPEHSAQKTALSMMHTKHHTNEQANPIQHTTLTTCHNAHSRQRLYIAHCTL